VRWTGATELKVGFYLTGSASSTHADLVEQVDYAEAAGFDSVWLRERHFHPDHQGRNFFTSPFLAGAYFASRTSRIRIGIGARVLPLDHPLHIAEAGATLDVLSGGRLDFGIARVGENGTYESAFGVRTEESRGRFEEALEIILRAWTGESFSFEGDHYRVPEVSVYPRPVTQPRPPVYLVGISPGTLAFGAARGFPLIVAGAQTVGVVRETQDAYSKLLAEHGFDPAGVVSPVNRFVYVAETNEEAERDTRETVLGFINRRDSVIRDFLKLPENEITYELLADRVCIFGDADRCREKLQRLGEQIDLRNLVCTFNYFTIDHARCRASMERFTERVLPALGA
jgi:alkanesulfonate monooxygenase SsuD/methylene tetrahydromethanopterin reductase-like flavin-dependent oxidoreductase (luciferase family)